MGLCCLLSNATVNLLVELIFLPKGAGREETRRGKKEIGFGLPDCISSTLASAAYGVTCAL